MAPRTSFGTAPALESSFTLPPLILHPFADATGPGKLVESSRASLKLQGLLPAGEATPEDLDRALLDGRYSEMRMLFYLGRDLARWIVEVAKDATLGRAYAHARWQQLVLHAIRAEVVAWIALGISVISFLLQQCIHSHRTP